MPVFGSALWRSLRAYQVYGANTNVGKTVASTILCKALQNRSPSEKVWYLKPVSTGPDDQADDRHVSRFAKDISTDCLFQFEKAVSPHIAARSMRSKPPSDFDIQARINEQLSKYAQTGPGVVLVETAGGVHSPTPSGTSQVDLYRPLRLPVVLIADHRLGGISLTISAFESLHIRGCDVDSVLVFEDAQYGNHEYLREYFGKRGVPTLSLPKPPEKIEASSEDQQSMAEYYDNVSKLAEVSELLSLSSEKHLARIESLETMASRAHKRIWYPFTQHQHISEETILPIDSAYGDFFQSYLSQKPKTGAADAIDSTTKALLQPTFDGSASWWTQGLGHANPDLSLTAAYAAGRYGHVMFAGAVHEPALSLADLLLKNLNNPRLNRVFYSDNGSTGIEIAVKMALGSACKRYGWTETANEAGVLGLKSSYHGDTIGAMDCSEPSLYNKKISWYRGRGYWFDFPQIKMQNGVWIVDPPAGLESELGPQITFDSLEDIFDISNREKTSGDSLYRTYIKRTIEMLIQEGKKFGAVMMEPVLLGAGGMALIDPLFQRSLVQVVRENPDIFSPSSSSSSETTSSASWSGLPVLFDEVFTGIYRLGRFSSSSFLQVHPDISVHAKLLTGGLVPLCTTLASESIFEDFLSSQKSDALLHGHSYTAHAVGCQVAETSLKMFLDMEKQGSWDEFKQLWSDPLTASEGKAPNPIVWSTWSKDFVTNLSHSEQVESMISLGSVLAISLKDQAGSGYASMAASGLQRRLIDGQPGWNIHSRVLGNVLYLMASQTSDRVTLGAIESMLNEALL